MRTIKRFNIVMARSDGGVELHRMKEWLREHPQHIPEGYSPDSNNSHQIRDALRRNGWHVEESDSEVRLTPPDQNVTADVEAILGSTAEQDANEDVEAAFELEAQLRDFIAANLQRIDIAGKRLKLFVSPDGRRGVEYATDVGRIDVLAVDDSGAFYVFELKRGRTPDHVIGQLTRYMGWLRHTTGQASTVHGIIVAKSISEHLRYAISVIPNVGLFEYEIEFRLKPATAVGL